MTYDLLPASEVESYQRGVAMAIAWIQGGGSLRALGPATSDLHMANGFTDMLAEASLQRAAMTSTSTHRGGPHR
jgi:hypothetical protein